jgi:glutamate racemase
VVTLGSAAAVAAQALRRAEPAGPGTGVMGTGVTGTGVASTADPATSVTSAGGAGATPGSVRVLLSGRPAALPEAAMRYPEGRLLARLVLAPAGRDRALSG